MADPQHKRIALYPGSFDPVTVGHIDVATRAGKLFDELIVAVAHDAEKRHCFSLEERAEMVEDALRQVENISVDSFKGLVVDYAGARGACALIKGLRTSSDFEHEMQMAMMNRSLAPGLETVFIMAMPEHSFISSTLVKHVHQLDGDVSRFVTPLTLDLLDRKTGR